VVTRLPSSVYALSEEQQAAVTLAQTGGDGAIVARAGSGKTFTLRAIAETTRDRTLLLAFNRAIAREAQARFPSHVEATTMHALAWRSIVAGRPEYRRKFTASTHANDATWCTVMGLDANDATCLTHLTAIRSILQAFLVSRDPAPSKRHVPEALRRWLAANLTRAARKDREAWWVRRAARTWRRMADPHDPTPLGHDAYLKVYALGRPRLPGDLLLVDEAQDLAPVMLDLLTVQDAPRILVGDPAQGIYGFRGAMDAMAASGYPEVRLTQSFRFGPEIAEVAQRALRIVAPGAKLRGAGEAGAVTFERPIATGPRTIVCRTTLGALEALLEHGEGGVHIVGGVQELLDHLKTASAAWRTQGGKNVPHLGRPGARQSSEDVTWQAFTAAADAEPGARRVARHLAERYGESLPQLAARIAAGHQDAEDAPVLITTIHRAKGREWDDVILWRDVRDVPTSPGDLARSTDVEEARSEVHLLYVALTRARRRLDLTHLSPTLKRFLAGG